MACRQTENRKDASMRIFLTRHSSLLGEFVNNLALGCKYGKHERALYLINTQHVVYFHQQLTPMRHAFFRQKHCF